MAGVNPGDGAPDASADGMPSASHADQVGTRDAATARAAVPETDTPAGAPAAPTQPTDPPAWRRLHPAGLVVALVRSARGAISLFVSLLVVFRIVADHWSVFSVVMLIVIAVIAAAATPIAAWASTKYLLGDDGLTITSGLFFRRHRTIGYRNIHAINSASPAYLQPFHVVQLTVSAGGAADADITLDAVPAQLQAELEELRSRARDRERPAQAAQPSPTPETATTSPAAVPAAQAPVFRASVKDIILFSITDLGFLAAAAVIYGFVTQLQDLLPKQWTDAAGASLDRFVVAQGVMAVAMLVLIGIIVLAVTSIAASLLRFYGFEVWRRGDDLMVVRGLLTRRTTTVPVRRIQTITIRQSLLRRPLHLCSVGLGLSTEPMADDDSSGASLSQILPVVSDARVYAVLREMLPEWDPRQTNVRLTGRGLTRYYLTMPLAAGVPASAAVGITGAIAGGYWWLLTLAPLAVTVYWTATRWMKSRAEGYMVIGNDESVYGDDRTEDGRGDGGANAACNMDGTHGNTGTGARCDGDASGISPNRVPEHMPNRMSNRIVVTGAQGLTRFTLFTRRARVQAFRRSTTPWREPRGIERVTMPLFVTNGISSLRFGFLHAADADALAAWATQARER